jgi:hypothetical protein
MVTASVPPIEQLVEKGIDRLHDNIFKKLHANSFSSILFYLHLDSHCTHLKFCAWPKVGAWLSPRQIIFSRLALDVVFSIVHIRLGLPHSLVLGLSNCICDQPLNPMEIHLFCYTHGREKTMSHDVVWHAFASIMKDVG